MQKSLALSLRSVGVAYKRRAGLFRRERYWALRDVSFDVYNGETLGVIGRNGAGKSTLLRVLAGIIAPDKGEVMNYAGCASLLALQVGFLNHLTGRENAILGGMMLGLSKQEVKSRMEDIRSYADIGDFFDQPVARYSTGMRARLGFSVAIHANPDVILLDEVLGVGDKDFREKSSRSMREKIKSNQTVVLVSHQIGLIAQVCDRVVWIESGHVKLEGRPEYVLDNYK